MSIFSKIKGAIFGKKDSEAKVAAAPAASAAAGQAAPAALSEIDVEAQLDGMSGSDKLNWRSSIVDLMKLIGLDASYAERKELAQELGRKEYGGSADDNIWLHRAVMNELVKNGGKVPANMRD